MAYKPIPMFHEQRFENLLKASVLADIDPGFYPTLYSLMECGQARAGECIRSIAEENASLFIVASGSVFLFEPGEHKPIARLRAGDSFGMLSLLFPGIACPDAYAVEPSKFAILNCESLHMMELSEPNLAVAIYRSIRARLTPLMSAVSYVVMRHCV